MAANVSFEQMRDMATAQAQRRADRENERMFIYVRDDVWYVRSMNDNVGAATGAVLAAVVEPHRTFRNRPSKHYPGTRYVLAPDQPGSMKEEV